MLPTPEEKFCKCLEKFKDEKYNEDISSFPTSKMQYINDICLAFANYKNSVVNSEIIKYSDKYKALSLTFYGCETERIIGDSFVFKASILLDITTNRVMITIAGNTNTFFYNDQIISISEAFNYTLDECIEKYNKNKNQYEQQTSINKLS